MSDLKDYLYEQDPFSDMVQLDAGAIKKENVSDKK
jgi:hypothetical protein